MGKQVMDFPILNHFTPILHKRRERIPPLLSPLTLPRWNLVRGGSRTYNVAVSR